MDPKKINDLAGRMQKGGKGLGAGIGFLAAAGTLAYGISRSFYTGLLPDSVSAPKTAKVTNPTPRPSGSAVHV